ncbi:hypothetical protein DEJ25_03505 [Curtobacterium sp. MCPF17_011]|uniref:hypothetical protein n=1 Tax=Curtobacterium sp. MCPF17_011 TaxID=2175652 RepID=UPI000DA9D459|nr:hypothetical protein [Curtobacterium sp. MCPF17_011]PZF14731.1 hypothetical protein DEJ25_03505 [Curtobacterium sp. MCPF17_011]
MRTTDTSTGPTTPTSPRHSHEIAAAVTLPSAARALVAPGPLTTAGGIAVTTACGALSTRVALLGFLADPDADDPIGISGHDPFTDPMPSALLGSGPEPDRDRVRRAGDRCVDAWRQWSGDRDSGQSVVGVGGALGLGAWCAWALGAELRAETRARYALDLRADDPLAQLVLRSCTLGIRAAWRG